MADDQQAVLSQEERLALLDWYKHLTTLAVLLIGGMIGFLPPSLPIYALPSLLLVTLGGSAAFSASMHMLPRAKPVGRQGRFIQWFAPNGVAGGAGLYIGGFIADRF